MDASKRKPRQAVVEVVMVELTCPNKRCNSPIYEPRRGSHLWETFQLENEIVVCPNCRQRVTLPTRVALPVGLGA